MTRLTHLTLFALLLGSPAWAKGGKPPKADPAPSADNTELKKQLDELCAKKDDPLKVPQPFQPTPASQTDAALEDGKPMTDDAQGKLKFEDKYCAKSRASATAAAKAACDTAYALVFRGWRDGNIRLKDALGKVCDKIKEIPTKCTDQSTSEQCTATIYKDSAAEIKKALPLLEEVSKKLDEQQTSHVDLAKKDTVKMKDPNASKYVARANAKAPASRTTESTITACSKPGASEFCEHIGAATDAGYYSGQFRIQLKEKSDLAAKFEKAGDTADARAKGGGDPNAKSGGGMDMNDMLKLATLGMTGAAMYCQMTKKCGNSSDPSQSSLTDPNATGGATSPTPSSTNPDGGSKTETSSLGNNTNGSSSNSPTGTAPQAATASTSYHGGSGGFSGEGAPHYGVGSGEGPGRGLAAASSGPVGGGGSTGASMGGGLLGSGTAGGDNTAKPSGSGNGDGGGGMMGGAGMGGASGGFNLGDGKSGSPADAALKNILNGDTPPVDAALDPVGGTAGTTAGADGGVEDAESLFTRVKETHVRCLKRGCVGREVGTNI